MANFPDLQNEPALTMFHSIPVKPTSMAKGIIHRGIPYHDRAELGTVVKPLCKIPFCLWWSGRRDEYRDSGSFFPAFMLSITLHSLLISQMFKSLRIFEMRDLPFHRYMFYLVLARLINLFLYLSSRKSPTDGLCLSTSSTGFGQNDVGNSFPGDMY